MAKKTLAPQQERSRESLRKLQKATAEVLGQHGVDGTTIPRIAQHAGLTPGAIYRRFHDKDALLEDTILGMLERQQERARTGMSRETAAQIPLPVFAGQIIGGMVLSYRVNASLLRAMRIFVQGRANTPFWKKACKLEVQSFDHVVELFLAHRKQIKHPDPRGAVAMGLMMVISTLFEIVVMPTDLGPLKDFLPKDDQALRRELVRAFLNYLGVEEKKNG
ncbi:MAG TPA: TetR/AcrR family transcriptional regulator [Candidatus Angelobacter sp.]|nr:TetR/AcrR family transcriptional regulator [Candidatus Angelobacter sp.]